MARTLIDVWREGGDAWLAVVFHPKSRETGAARTLLFTDARALYTGPGESPPNARFITRLMPTWKLKRAVAASGNLTGPSSIETASFDLENSDGSLTFLKGLVWADQPFEVYLGSPRGPAGDVVAFSDYLRLFSGVTVQCTGTTQISISAIGRKSSLDNPLVQNYYHGYGMGVLVPADGTSRLIGTASEDHNVAGALAIEWIGVLLGTHTGTGFAPLFQVSNFYGLILSAAGALGFVTGASETDTSSIRFSAYTPPTGVPIYLAGVVAPDGVSVTLYAAVWATNRTTGVAVGAAGFALGALTVVGTLTMPVAVSKTDPDHGIPLVGRAGTSSVGLHVWEIRLRAAAPDYDTLLASSDRPLPAGGAGVTGILDAWRFGEDEGTTALSELRRVDLTLQGAASWKPSLDGDDPAVFSGGPLGQTKPTCWGPVFHFPLVLLDTQTRTYGWRSPEINTGLATSTDIWGRLRANGVPLVPDETIALGAAGSISFGFDDPHVISLSGTDANTSLPMTAKRLVPGQLDPDRTGQRISVTGTSSNNGTFTIAKDGAGGQPAISPDGRDIRVEEVLISETLLAPTPVVIRTLAADRQYTYDLPNSTASLLVSTQAGAFGIDATGGPAGAYTASALFGVVSDSTVDTSGLLWNPNLAVGHLLNASTTRKAVLDSIALSAMAWWVEDETGSFRLITIRPPVGSPSRRFRPEIIAIRNLSSTDPFSRITVGYGKNYLVVDKSNIPGSVPANLRSRLSTDYQLLPRSAGSATMKNFPQAKPRTEPFQTYLLDDPAAASTWLDYAAPLFLEERSWWEVTLAGAWIAAAVRAGDEHEFVYEPPTGTFENGASARIMSVSVDKGSNQTVLEVLT